MLKSVTFRSALVALAPVRKRSTPLPSAIAAPVALAVLLAQPLAAQETSAGQNGSQKNNGQQSDALEEIIVTATKRSEAVRDISGSVTAKIGRASCRERVSVKV